MNPPTANTFTTSSPRASKASRNRRRSQILPRVLSWASFGISANAVYFAPDAKTLQRLDVSTGGVTTLATLDRRLDGMCVSPDGAFVVWPQRDHDSSDLMLVEGFR